MYKRQDLVIDGMPVIDYSNGGSALEFVRTLNNLLRIDFDTVIPGHGRVLTKDDVRAYVPKFELMNKRMADLVKKHVPKDQLEKQLKLDDLGWAHTVSTGTFTVGGILAAIVGAIILLGAFRLLTGRGMMHA